MQDSSWVILVTDSSNLLSASEKNFLNDYAGKPNIDLMVNVLPDDDKSQVEKDLEKILGTEKVEKILIKVGQENLNVLDQKFKELASKDSIMDAQVFSAIKILSNRKKDLEIAQNNLSSIFKGLKNLESQLQLKQDQIYSNFKQFDLKVLEQDLSELVLGLNNFFKTYSFWMLMLKSDYLAQDIQILLKDYTLMNGELQVRMGYLK